MKSINDFINEQFICERFVNCHTPEDMKKYANDVWKILTKSYEYCGGMAGMDSVEQLIDETTLWKLVRKEGKIVAYIKGKALCFELFNYQTTLFNGWSC